MTRFVWPVRVYYEDTDSGGVVYYANYLKFMERARTEYLRDLGYEQDELVRSDGVLFAVRSIAVEYLQPARFNQLLHVTAQVTQARKASLIFDQHVLRADDADRKPLCSAQVKIACLDAQTLRPQPIPQRLIKEVTGER